jgi:hypothetical protein
MPESLGDIREIVNQVVFSSVICPFAEDFFT